MDREKKRKVKRSKKKNGALRRKLRERYPGYMVQQYNVSMDVLGVCSMTMEEGLRKLLGKKMKDALRNMQKSVV